jgi:hypothetical protein
MGHKIRDFGVTGGPEQTLSGLKVGTPIAIHVPNGVHIQLVILGHFSDTDGDCAFGSLGHGSRTRMVARSRFSALH